MKEFFKIVNLEKYRYLLSNKSIFFTKKNGNFKSGKPQLYHFKIKSYLN